MRRSCVAAMIAGLTLLAGCSSGPKPPQPGTPAFFWAAAKSTYDSGDYLKAGENLSQVVRSDNEFTPRAQPWLIVLSSGMADAYIDLARNFEAGARANRANPTPFRRQVTLFHAQASAAAIQAAETLHNFMDMNKVDPIPLEFGYPRGSANQPVQLERIAKGILFPAAEIELLQKEMIQRGVLMSVARLSGAGGDVPKALELFNKGDVKIARAAFLFASANSLHDQADLFCPKKLDQPQKVKMLCQEAEEALRSIPETKQTKELMAKIAKLRKLMKIS